jgi:hypothetical protein
MAWAAMRGEPVPFAVQMRSHGWDPAHILQREFDGPDGAFSFELPMGVFYLVEVARGYHLGPAFAVLSLVGAVRVLRRPVLVPIATLIGWPVLVLVFLAGDTTQNTRFALAVLPPVAVLAAGGVEGLVRAIERLGQNWRRPLRLATIAAVAVALAWMAVGAWRFTDAFIARFQVEQAAVEELAGLVPVEDRLLSFGATLALRHAGRDAIELYDLDGPGVTTLVADGRPTWVLAPDDARAAQWVDAPPGRALQALESGPGLVLVHAAGRWVLYRVPLAEPGG